VLWSISDEIGLVKNYLNIESVRLKEKLEFSINISPGSENILIPCLIIEPLVENAITHGIKKAVFGGKIEIDIMFDNDLIITVKDTLNANDNYPISESTSSGEQIGIENIKKRLGIIYGEKAKFCLSITRHGALSTILINGMADFKYDGIPCDIGG
jgi:sensor histidine kinase YesM